MLVPSTIDPDMPDIARDRPLSKGHVHLKIARLARATRLDLAQISWISPATGPVSPGRIYFYFRLDRQHRIRDIGADTSA